MVYIDVHKGELGVEPICRVLTEAGTQIAPSAYYAAKTRPPSARSVSGPVTTAVIEAVHTIKKTCLGPSWLPALSTP